MKILYFMRALPDPLYERLLNEGYALNNPSNQNFHSRLIASLRLGAEVECVTILPSNIASKDIVRYPGWHYLVPRGILLPLANQFNDLAINDFDIVLFDTLAVKLGQVAVAKAKEKGVKAVGIITDHPKNIAKAPFYFRIAVNELWKGASASFALCPALVLPNKPSFLLPGIVREEAAVPHKEESPYLYFAGALSSRFGAPSLVEAYLKADLRWPLLVAGHASDLQINDNRIVFLGQLTEKENASYEAGAAILLNPRPLDPELDQESIPSKVFEYLASGRPIVSTPHPYFYPRYKDSIDFIDESAFEKYFLAHKDEKGGLKDLKPNISGKMVVNEYGVSHWTKPLLHFLEEMMAASN